MSILNQENFNQAVNGEVVTLTLKEESKDWYEKTITEESGFTLDQVNKINHHNNDVLKNVATDAKDVAKEIFVGNKEAQKVIFDIPNFADNKAINFDFSRAVERNVVGTDEKVINPELRIVITDPSLKLSKGFNKKLTKDIKEALANC